MLVDFHGLIWLIVFALAFRYGLPWFIAYLRKKRLAASGIADIDTMDGKAFEQYLEVLFSKLGYKVERTRYVGDYGADLITRKDGVKTVIQAKRYTKAVGIKAVQEAVAAKGMYDCTEAMVVTNSTYTRAAVELARANRVALWDRNRLVETLLRVKDEAEAIMPAPQPSAPQPALSQLSFPHPPTSVVPICTTCGVQVSEKVQQYCMAHLERFGGAIYCFQHQKAFVRETA
ncbi:MAG: restriction endonuclease [Janthinobacterium lividum]